MKVETPSNANAIASHNELDQDPKGKTLSPPSFSLTAGSANPPIQRYNEKDAQNTRCQVHTDPVDAEWATFATQFNKEFRSVLHVFTNTAMQCNVDEPGKQEVPYIGRKITPATKTTPKKIDPSPSPEAYDKVPETAPGTSEANATESPLYKPAKIPASKPETEPETKSETKPETEPKSSEAKTPATTPATITTESQTKTPTTEPTAPTVKAKPPQNTYAQKGQQSGPDLTPEACAILFTTGQRDKLLQFIDTKEIPDRLFNGDDIGNTNAQQRILMSAYILANGTYKAGSFVQRVHARMCWHWVHITNDYAGTSTGSFNKGMMGSTDHMGNAVWNDGTASTYYDGPFQPASKLPSKETQGYGPIPKGSKQEESLTKEQEAMYASADPASYKQTIGRKQGMTWDQLSKIQPGDWLYVFNSNGSNIGCHSVIFSHWASDVISDDAVPYRRAVLFSQGQPGAGGKEHNNNIGTAYFNRPGVKEDKKKGIKPVEELKVVQVCWATRFSSDANPAIDSDEMAPAMKGDAGKITANEKYLTDFETKEKFKLDRAAMMDALRMDAVTYLSDITDDLSKGQIDTINLIINDGDLLMLIKTIQRLKALQANIKMLREFEAAAYDENLEAKHQEWLEKKLGLEATDAQYTAELEALEAELDSLESEKAPIDLKGLKKKLKDSKAALAAMQKKNAKKTKATQKAKAGKATKAAKATPGEIIAPEKTPTSEKTATPGEITVPEKTPTSEKSPTPEGITTLEKTPASEQTATVEEIKATEETKAAEEIAALEAQIKALEEDPEALAKANETLKELNTKIAELKKTQKAKAKDQGTTKKALDKLAKEEPYASVHPGNWMSSQDNTLPNGSLPTLMPTTRLKEFLTKEPMPPKPTPTPKKKKK